MFKDLEFVKKMSEALTALGYKDIRISLALSNRMQGYYAYEVHALYNDKDYASAGDLIIDAPFAEVERMIIDSFRRTISVLKGVEEVKAVEE